MAAKPGSDNAGGQYVLNCCYAMRFVWDKNKDRANLAKHGVAFAVAARVLDDPRALSFTDRVVDGEQRWKTVGWAAGVPVVLSVAHTVTGDGESETIRIISARKATASERKSYEEGED
jgi:uncharacterized DUF497 family protein